ncbi:MAG TPA: polysaccharide deacetylase family protein [Bryobacteraceae bacterium]|nr:polysaccharide deacetylase family protein [Bryobacteraceae bacterium]
MNAASLKRTALAAVRSAGVFELTARTRWRSSRLLILGYHGVSLADEHEWDPALFITPATLDARLQALRRSGAAVLPLGEAVERLYAGTLPARAVALTFDDGYYDFRRLAWPLLKTYGVPATVYLTTYYCEDNRPVPGITLSYMLWKARERPVRITALPGFPGTLALADAGTRANVVKAFAIFADESRLSADDKDALLRQLARELGFDYDRFHAERILHVMRPEDARALAADGADIQLHTHRHRVPRDATLFRREIEDNRLRIESFTGRPATHFCFPSGEWHREALSWLPALNVKSAATCKPGIASRSSERLLLPRFLDHSRVSQAEFEAWVSGVGHAIRRR